MKSPSTVKEIQSLKDRAAALNRFLSKSTDKCRPFFKALKNGQKDKWDEEWSVEPERSWSRCRHRHPDGTLLEQAITLGCPASNSEAEYEALLAGLCLAKELSIKKLAIYSDSQLITSQASGEYMAKHPRMILYLDKVQEVVEGVSLDTQFRRFILVKHLDQPSIEEVEQPDLMQIEEDPSWKNPIIDYLVNENLPKEKSEAKKT
ncbi:hypothetical protein L3X38_025707 [Prunus dulcis]|uniref:RNase H type-1 domain-containing protein n=1 Tax=Prunus dulcis TaxID=3755 RepID=A0AAD4Z7N9_PRUDU|nr:hypothetical protein L3X38_025707 [Prunus dulcis]